MPLNFMKTAILLAAMTALFMGVGFMLGGEQGMMIALAMALAINVFSYWNSDKMVLSMHGAQEVTPEQAPELYALVQDLATRAGLPMPAIYVIENDQPNAFATGRDPEHAAVAVHTGLMHMLTHEELAGVIAHELAHIKHRDTLIMTITATLAGALSSLTQMAMFSGGNRERGVSPIFGIIAMILAPLAASVVQMAISRSREYAADEMGGQICGNPLWLASGLVKISNGVAHIPNETAQMHPATAHMFIMNPLSGGAMDGLFSTHPNPQNRVDALVAQAEAMGNQVRESLQLSPARAKNGPWG